MNSYHDLSEQVYNVILSKPFTRIHGTVDWILKETIMTEASYVGLECQVIHDWEGGLGLMVDIVVAMRYAAENPILPPYDMLTQPLSSASLPDNPSAAQICTLTDKIIHNALDLEFFESLQYLR